MALFFLNVRTELCLEVDREGADFADRHAARREALDSAIDLWGGFIQTGRDPGGFQFEVASEDGENDFVVTFAEALRDRAAVTWRLKASRLVS
jgi:hypothetical protein